MTNLPPPAPTGLPPPIYAASQPQILVAPLPDSASFFWGRTVQGEVFVKGLGTQGGSRGVKHLSVKLHLVNRLPDHPDLELHEFPDQIIWPPSSPSTSTSSSSSSAFPSVHRFTIALPHDPSARSDLPGTLNLTDFRKGEVKWWLRVTLALASGEVHEEIQVEGTPQDVERDHGAGKGKGDTEVEAVLDKHGVVTRLLVEDPSPRLGSLLRLGVEFQPKGRQRQRTAVAALATMPDPAAALRALRRVRVELYRLVQIPAAPSASTSTLPTETREHLTLLHASGKSLRYPGPAHPPLRVLFTLPTAQLGSTVDQTWGEISMSTPYHTVTFFVRVILGFGALAEVTPEEMRDFVVEQKIEIRPRVWREPREVVVERGLVPDAGVNEEDVGMSEEEMAKEAYRRKGQDRVGGAGTFRSHHEDGPPEFDEAGPSTSQPRNAAPAGELPTFLESEAQAASGEAPLPSERIMTERLVPHEVNGDEGDRATAVGRRGSLSGELGTWVEYDGYETFSVAPPSVSASFGASGSMDPPHPDDEDVNVAGGLAARLGFSGPAGGVVGGMELMEQLGLGEGTRVIDLQDDLPPGIDEPSLPALPTFTQSTYPSSRYRAAAHPSHPAPPPPHAPIAGERSHDVSPPSFAASEAAQAQAVPLGPIVGMATGRRATPVHPEAGDVTPPPPIEAGDQGREAPPGYFGGVVPAAGGGPPAYS